MVKQKTWVDLLGSDITNCEVDSRFIVRCSKLVDGYKLADGYIYRCVIWSFGTQQEAEAAFKAWQDEVAALAKT